MRNIIVSEFITIDGVIEGPGPQDAFKFAGWSMAYGAPEIFKFKYDELFATDALLLGRITYEGFASAWPKMTDAGEFGDRMNSIEKFVVSDSLENLEWRNSKLLGKNVVEEISAHKRQAGKDILVFGSSKLIQTLMQHNLIDEYRLLVYPIVLGEGKRLFKEGSTAKLKLVEEKKFDTGVVLIRYMSAM